MRSAVLQLSRCIKRLPACDFPGKGPTRCESTYCHKAESSKLIPRELKIDHRRLHTRQPKESENVGLQLIMHVRSSSRFSTICRKPCIVIPPKVIHTFSCCRLFSISWSILMVRRVPRYYILTVILQLRHRLNCN